MAKMTELSRKTRETSIEARLELNGSGQSSINTQIYFLKHLLESFVFHGRFDLMLEARGDIEVDQHHLLEDCGLVLGQLFRQALKELKGINRAGFFVMPMDDALALAAVDISGRPYVQYELKTRRRFCGDLDTDQVEEFFNGFSRGLMANLVIKAIGKNDHHKLEAVFKAFGRALKYALSIEEGASEIIRDYLPSLKGIIDL